MLGLQMGVFPPIHQDTVSNNIMALESFLNAIDNTVDTVDSGHKDLVSFV